MIPINGSNSSGVNLNKYVLKNVFNTVVNDLSDNVNKNKLDIEDIKNKVDAANDKFEWLAFDVSNEYTSEYNMKRCFNKYGDSFLIRETSVTTLGEYEIHECKVNTMYGPNIQYKFISDYVYLPSWIRDKSNSKLIYHVAECDFIMNKDTVNCSAKKIEFGEGWNRILVRYSIFEHIKINSDCLNVGIGNNSELKDIDLTNCYQLNRCEISNNPNIKNKCFMMSCTPSIFSTNNNNNTYLDTSQNWFISGDGMWRGKFLSGWHYQDVEFFDRFGNGLIARIPDSNNDSGFYKSISGHDIVTDYFKFPSTVLFSNDLYNDKRLVHIPRVAMSVYTDSSFTTKNFVSNARILDFSNGITGVDWTYDNKVEKIILSPSTTSLNLNYDTALNSINLVDCDKLDSLTIQNCTNITQVVLQHRPTTLNLDSTIKLIVLDEMNNSINSNTSSINSVTSSVNSVSSTVTTLNNNVTALDTRLYRLENTIVTFPTSKYELIFYTNITKSEPYIDPETQMIPVVKIIDHASYIEWMAYISPTTKTLGHVDLIKTVNNPNKWNWAVLKDYQTGEEETTVDSVLCVEVPTMFLNCMYYDIKGTGFHTTIISHLIYKNILPGRLTLYDTNVKYGLTYSSPGGLYLYNSEVFDLMVDTVNYNVSAADTTNFKEFENSTIHHRNNITTNGISESV